MRYHGSAKLFHEFFRRLRLTFRNLAAGQTPLTLAAKWQRKELPQCELVFIAIRSDTNRDRVLWNVATQRPIQLVPPAKNRAKV